MKTFKEFMIESIKNGYSSVLLGFFRKSKSVKRLKESEDSIEHIDNLHHSLSKHYSKFDENHIKTIHKYSGGAGGGSHNDPNGSEVMNKHLHQNRGKIENTPHHDLQKRMDRVVNRHETPHDMHVYTGIHHDHDLRKIAASHNSTDHIKIHNHAFTSTSIDKHVAKSFASRNGHGESHTIKIHVPKGHKGAYIAHHSGQSASEDEHGPGGEKEFVLPRNTKLHIHPKPTVEKGRTESGREIHHHIWHAKIVKE